MGMDTSLQKVKSFEIHEDKTVSLTLCGYNENMTQVVRIPLGDLRKMLTAADYGVDE